MVDTLVTNGFDLKTAQEMYMNWFMTNQTRSPGTGKAMIHVGASGGDGRAGHNGQPAHMAMTPTDRAELEEYRRARNAPTQVSAAKRYQPSGAPLLGASVTPVLASSAKAPAPGLRMHGASRECLIGAGRVSSSVEHGKQVASQLETSLGMTFDTPFHRKMAEDELRALVHGGVLDVSRECISGKKSRVAFIGGSNLKHGDHQIDGDTLYVSATANVSGARDLVDAVTMETLALVRSAMLEYHQNSR
jgi:hypothetical protein